MDNNRLWLGIAAYIVGLGVAELSLEMSPFPLIWGGFALLLSGVLLSQVMPRCWRWGPRSRDWLLAGLIGLMAVGWWSLRYPTPQQGDISQFVERDATQLVTGWIETMPRINRRDRLQFWLHPKTVQTLGEGSVIQSTRGKLYVTLPQTATTDSLWPGQQVQITGNLYRPQASLNPDGFNFKSFLARRGSFAGMSGQELDLLVAEPPLGKPRWQYTLAQLRSRMVAGSVAGLGEPNGQLVSSMVLGRRAVNLPYSLQDEFLRAGLAHTLAASGFHVSLLLAVVLSLTHGRSARLRLGLGGGSLLLYVLLTGVQASVMRAALMGLGALVGTTLDRRTRPIGALVTAGFLLLLVNPMWMGSVGFWLSWLATLGLLVSVPALMLWFDWLPAILASLIAVPIAASLWVMPLQLHTFGTLSPYSIILSAVTTPFVVVITLVGMASSLASVVSLFLGGAIAWTLTYPVKGLIWLVHQANQLPGSSVTIGNIFLGTMLVIYGLWLLGWLHPWWQTRRWLAGTIALLLVLVPAGVAHAMTVEMTVLATQHHPTIVIRDHGRSLVLTDGDLETVQYTLLPYLRQRGMHRVDLAITPWLSTEVKHLDGWQLLLENTAIGTVLSGAGIQQPSDLLPHTDIQPLPIQAPVTLGDITLTVPRANPLTLQLQQGTFTSLLLPTLWNSSTTRVQQAQRTLLQSGVLNEAVDMFYWSGAPLLPEFVTALTTPVAIAAAAYIDRPTIEVLQQNRIQILVTGLHGAIRATPQQGIEAVSVYGVDLANF